MMRIVHVVLVLVAVWIGSALAACGGPSVPCSCPERLPLRPRPMTITGGHMGPEGQMAPELVGALVDESEGRIVIRYSVADGPRALVFTTSNR